MAERDTKRSRKLEIDETFPFSEKIIAATQSLYIAIEKVPARPPGSLPVVPEADGRSNELLAVGFRPANLASVAQ